jgi:two-component system, sensor histidine kinase YesM
MTINDKERMKVQLGYNLNKLIASREYISRVVIIKEEETLFQFRNYLQEEAYFPYDQVHNLKGNIFWLPSIYEQNYTSIIKGVYEISALRAINDLDSLNKVIAYERINIFESDLMKLYVGVGNTNTKSIFIINNKGDVVSATDKNMLETSIKNEHYFDKIINEKEGYFTVDDTIISFYKFQSIDWMIVKVDDLALVTGENITEIIILISILFTILFGVFFYILQQRYIIKPILEIKNDVSRIRNARYDFNLHTTSEDEIADLNKSLILMGTNMQKMIDQESALRVSAKESQLQYLQSQINPHFLYNTLDSIRWMALKDKNEYLANQITALSNHFRHALNEGRDMTTVLEEVNHIEGYLLIQRNRFGKRLHADIEIEDEVKDFPVLNLILQPLVENAIVHGLERKIGDWLVEIKIFKQEGCIVYSVKDNGLGVDEGTIKEKMKLGYEGSDALALHNVNKRLKYKYGDEYGIEFHSEIGQGTIVIIKTPITGEETS